LIYYTINSPVEQSKYYKITQNIFAIGVDKAGLVWYINKAPKRGSENADKEGTENAQ